MGKALGRPRQRYIMSAMARMPAPPPIPGTELALARYRALPPNHGAGRPARQHGRVGSYWTVPARVPLSELTGLTAIVYNVGRLYRVRMARQGGIVLPPIQCGVRQNGSMWLIDGNHRLTDARSVGQTDIEVIFTFEGT